MCKHSKTPWTADIHLSQIRDSDGNSLASLPYTLGDEQDRANAEFIVRAVNSHDDLLKAAEAGLEVAVNLFGITEGDGFPGLEDAILQIRSAIIWKAKGE